jgi:hypothetical protein
MEVASTNGSVAKCKFCGCVLNNKYSDLKRHTTTKKHKLSSGTTGQTLIPFAKESTLSGAKLAEGNICLFTANHSAILSSDHLVAVCKKSFKT